MSGSTTIQSERTTGKLLLRYEDVAQDGRILLTTMPVALGVLWRAISIPVEARRKMRDLGVLPILTRFAIEAAPGPFAVEDALEVAGGFALSHAVGADGKVARIFLDMDATLTGKKGRTNLPPPEDRGAQALAGTLDVEHVFTRPFAGPDERKVLALDFGGEPFVPEKRREWTPPHEVVALPPSARVIDASFVEDPQRIALGVMHTDSNQHVNSLVYPRIFEEASLRRLAALGRPTSVLARSLTVAYRRPSFAGESLRVFVRVHEEDGAVACTGYFFGERDDVAKLERARVFIRMRFE